MKRFVAILAMTLVALFFCSIVCRASEVDDAYDAAFAAQQQTLNAANMANGTGAGAEIVRDWALSIKQQAIQQNGDPATIAEGDQKFTNGDCARIGGYQDILLGNYHKSTKEQSADWWFDLGLLKWMFYFYSQAIIAFSEATSNYQLATTFYNAAIPNYSAAQNYYGQAGDLYTASMASGGHSGP